MMKQDIFLHPPAVEAAADAESLSSWASWGDSASSRVAASPLRKPLGFPWPYLPMATCGQSHAWPICFHHMLTLERHQGYFQQRFYFGLVKLGVKTKSCSGVGFSISGSSHTDTGKVRGRAGTKYKWYGSCRNSTENGTQITLWEHSLQLKTRYIKV